MSRYGIALLITLCALTTIDAEDTKPATTVPMPAQPTVIAQPRSWEIGVTAGLNSVVSNNALLKKNEGAEIGLQVTLPWHLWKEERNLLSLRGQLTNYSNGIELPTANALGQQTKLVNASHSQVRLDWRQVFLLWDIDWTFGFGVQIPVTSSVLTPRGEYSFAEAKNYYPDAVADLGRIDRSTGVFLRFGIDQKFFDDALLLGAGFEVMVIESPRTEQRFALNLYAGAKVW